MLLSILTSAALAMNGDCITPQIMSALGELPERVSYPAPPNTGEKLERDSGYDLPNQERSENFVVKWGDSWDRPSEVAALLETLEIAWSSIVGEMGYPHPVGADEYLVNIYIAESGEGSPSSFGAAGYQTYDSEGWVMIVMNPSVLSGNSGDLSTAVHEFFHAVQGAMGTFEYWGKGAWFFEATACWIEPEVLEEDLSYFQFLFGYALIPNYPLYFFDYPDQGVLPEFHQYGAFIFPRYLSEWYGDATLIKEMWERPTLDNDPLTTLETLIEEDGVDIRELFDDFAAHNAFWDYSDGDHYELWVEYYARNMREWDCSEVVSHEWKGSAGVMEEADEECLPEDYGYNVLSLEDPAGEGVMISFEGASAGEKLGVADWRARVVVDRGGDLEYLPFELVDGVGSMLLCDDSIDEVKLVVSVFSSNPKNGETFDYSYELTSADDLPGCGDEGVDSGLDTGLDTGDDGGEGEEPAGGCGCDSTGGQDGWIAALALLPMLIRRDRVPVRAPVSSRRS